MDMEKLIRSATRDKSDNLDVDLPSFEEVWKKVQEQKISTDEKKRRKRNLSIGGWLEVVAVVLIVAVLPVTITKLRNLETAQISSSNKQEAAVTQADIQESRKIAQSFLTEFYNVEDYKKIDIKNLNTQYPKDKYTNELRKIATEQALEPFIANRLQLGYITYCYELHVNSLLISSSVGKHSNEDDGSIVYNFNGKVKLTFIDEDKQKEEDISGQITVNKIDNKWTITKFNNVSIDSIGRHYKNSKQ